MMKGHSPSDRQFVQLSCLQHDRFACTNLSHLIATGLADAGKSQTPKYYTLAAVTLSANTHNSFCDDDWFFTVVIRDRFVIDTVTTQNL